MIAAVVKKNRLKFNGLVLLGGLDIWQCAD